MILVDTSVWVRCWQRRPGYVEPLEYLGADDQAGGHEMIHGELTAGDNGGRLHFLRDYRLLPWAPRVNHDEVLALARMRRLCGRGLGWVDLHLLAAAMAAGWRLWTADQRLLHGAAQLGIAWVPGRANLSPDSRV